MGRVDEFLPGEEDIVKPDVCPCCGSALEERGAFLYCPNVSGCIDQIVMRVSHFAGREAMDIDAFSEKTARQLCLELNIHEPADLYELSMDKLISLDRFGEKKAQKLLEEIEKSKSARLSNFIFALGIPNIGVKTARDLADRYGSAEALMNAKHEELTQMNDIGDTVAASVVGFFRDEKNLNHTRKLLALGVKPVWQSAQTGGRLSGQTVVVTGTLIKYSRSQIEELIRQNGGKAASSVSAKTSFVLAGESAGSKLAKAQALGIKIISEDEFEAMIS